MLFARRQLILGQLAASLILVAVGYSACYAWDYILVEHDAAHFFDGKDATFDMLGLAVGYTYVNIVRDFISTITERTTLLATVQMTIARDCSISEETLKQIIDLFRDVLSVV